MSGCVPVCCPCHLSSTSRSARATAATARHAATAAGHSTPPLGISAAGHAAHAHHAVVLSVDVVGSM